MATPKRERCEHCGDPLPVQARSIARFCSGRCRVAAHRARKGLPKEMTSRPRWVRRTARKVPLTVSGSAASSTDPATWSNYSEASRSSVGTGLGFVLNGDGIVCLDLDHCVTDGRANEWARRILDRLPATFVEISVSGTGLHVFGLGRVGRGRRLRVNGGTVEVYGRERYIAVTGERLVGAPRKLADISEVVEALLR